MRYRYIGTVPASVGDIKFNSEDVKDVPFRIQDRNFIEIYSSQEAVDKQEKPSPKTTQKRSAGRPAKSSEPNIVTDDSVSENKDVTDKSNVKEKE